MSSPTSSAEARRELGPALRNAVKNLGLVELVVRESVGGLQAIAKYRECVSGPWGVGCDEDPVAAIEKALAAGIAQLAHCRRQLLPAPPRVTADEFDDILG